MADVHASQHDYHLSTQPWPATRLGGGVSIMASAHQLDAHLYAAAPMCSARRAGRALHMFACGATLVRRPTRKGHHTRVVQLSYPPLRDDPVSSLGVMSFVAWFLGLLRRRVFSTDAKADECVTSSVGGVVAAQGHRDLRSLASCAAQHAILHRRTTVPWAHHALLA